MTPGRAGRTVTDLPAAARLKLSRYGISVRIVDKRRTAVLRSRRNCNRYRRREDPKGLFDTGNAQAAGRSAPGVFRSETFDFQLMRWLSQAPYSGSELGECFAAAHLIKDGDIESWLREWEHAAQRVEGIARACRP